MLALFHLRARALVCSRARNDAHAHLEARVWLWHEIAMRVARVAGGKIAHGMGHIGREAVARREQPLDPDWAPRVDAACRDAHLPAHETTGR